MFLLHAAKFTLDAPIRAVFFYSLVYRHICYKYMIKVSLCCYWLPNYDTVNYSELKYLRCLQVLFTDVVINVICVGGRLSTNNTA